MFVDITKIKVKAGNGGNGVVSFHREKFVAAGGPDGGDGGNGGDVIFVVDDNLSTLADFKFKRIFKAPAGEQGQKRNRSGKGGEDLIVKVPRGTLVKEAESGQLMADMSTDERVVIAHGGRGGWGNQHFATPTRQVPRFAKPGTLGEEFELTLELKLLADVGLVGFPNVGKSTLISTISSAKPKVANYHFTTLVPILGVVRVEEEKSFVMADIPGLIEGAADGVGLGHNFLRHVDRCRLLVHIVDVSGSEGRDPKEDFLLIVKELESFNPEIAKRKQIVVGNKSDLATSEQIEDFKAFIEQKGLPFYNISAATRQGTKELIYAIWEELKELPPIKEYTPTFMRQEAKLMEKADDYAITLQNGVYYIDAPWAATALAGADLDDYESLQYFQRLLRSKGVIDKLEEMGIKDGDTVRIFELEFTFMR